MTDASPYRAPALEKGLDILELMARETVPLALHEVSDRLQRSKGEIFRMLLVLEERGYIARSEGGDGYTITNRLFMLGMTRPPVKTLLEACLPAMERLADRIWQSCHLVVAAENEIVVIARVDSPGDLGYAVRIGHRRLINQSASGSVLFAHQPKDVRDAWLQRLLEHSPFDADEFLSRTDAVRTQGYARARSDRVGLVVDVSVPLIKDGRAIATIAVPFVEQKPERESITSVIAMVRETAGQVSETLRFGPATIIAPGTPPPGSVRVPPRRGRKKKTVPLS